MYNKGNLIYSDKSIYKNYHITILFVICMVIFIILGLFIKNYTAKFSFYTEVKILMLLGILYYKITITILDYHNQKTSSCIYVYENCLEGTAFIEKNFLWTLIKLYPSEDIYFLLNYSNICYADIVGSKLILFTPYRTYKIYIKKNTEKIYTALFEKINAKY